MTVSTPVLCASNLVKSFGKAQALNGFELDINPGEVTAILGSNGAGKTTFIRCALGLTQPSKGALTVFGKKPGKLSVRQRIGAMLQASDLPELLTAREHIELFSSYYPRPLASDELLSLCQLEAFADKQYKTLSGGQKRRVQFALAIVGQPELIFLDEPTTGLDTQARRTLWDTVRSLSQSGASIVLTTHYLEEADALADRIIILHEGRVVADGKPDEIRGVAGGAIIRFVSEYPFDALAKLPGVRRARKSGRYIELITRSAPQTLKALFEVDPNPADLTVSKPDLDDAMRELIDATQEKD